MARLARDRPANNLDGKFSVKDILYSLQSPHVILLLVQLFCTGTMLHGLALFLPSIVNELGYSATHTQLIGVGPFAAGFVGMLLSIY